MPTTPIARTGTCRHSAQPGAVTRGASFKAAGRGQPTPGRDENALYLHHAAPSAQGCACRWGSPLPRISQGDSRWDFLTRGQADMCSAGPSGVGGVRAPAPRTRAWGLRSTGWRPAG